MKPQPGGTRLGAAAGGMGLGVFGSMLIERGDRLALLVFAVLTLGLILLAAWQAWLEHHVDHH